MQWRGCSLPGTRFCISQRGCFISRIVSASSSSGDLFLPATRFFIYEAVYEERGCESYADYMHVYEAGEERGCEYADGLMDGLFDVQKSSQRRKTVRDVKPEKKEGASFEG